jgi:hypothetical protein
MIKKSDTITWMITMINVTGLDSSAVSHATHVADVVC